MTKLVISLQLDGSQKLMRVVILLFYFFRPKKTEYATVGYVEKRIRLRKTQYQMMQKLVESRKKTVTVALEAEMEHAPRQTVRPRLSTCIFCYYCTI